MSSTTHNKIANHINNILKPHRHKIAYPSYGFETHHTTYILVNDSNDNNITTGIKLSITDTKIIVYQPVSPLIMKTFTLAHPNCFKQFETTIAALIDI